ETRHRRVRGAGADGSFAIGWSNCPQISTDIPRRQTDGAEAGNLEMGEVLTNAPPFLKDFLHRRCHLGCCLVVLEISMNPLGEVQSARQQRFSCPKRDPGIVCKLFRASYL